MLQPMRYKSFYRKWAGQKNMKVIICMCKWALTRWDEATTIDLASKLPALWTEVEAWMEGRWNGDGETVEWEGEEDANLEGAALSVAHPSELRK
ncbi:hypothetical protein K438DRAFT_2021742 [Mycena galopus ATCC 62051]|nr:hypothetical protein K438DRAFT_2021742 [Mycena galopus ATCC 62051]